MEKPRSDEELASRSNNGLTVTLMWVPDANRTYVNVLDDNNGEYHKIDVVPPAKAHEVYQHPFSYLGQQGVERAGVILGEE